jgi:hypothetical protein
LEELRSVRSVVIWVSTLSSSPFFLPMEFAVLFPEWSRGYF